MIIWSSRAIDTRIEGSRDFITTVCQMSHPVIGCHSRLTVLAMFNQETLPPSDVKHRGL
jgi:hypothetical protein